MSKEVKAKAVFLDRDGTLNHDDGYVHRIEDFRLLDGVEDGLKRMQDLGYRLIIVSNQSGVGRGYFSEADVRRFNDHLTSILGGAGVVVDAVYFSPHWPDSKDSRYRQHPEMRKPEPGMLLLAAKDHNIDLRKSFMIGDSVSDIEAGRKAGCRTIWIGSGGAGDDQECRPDFQADNLREAATVIESEGKV